MKEKAGAPFLGAVEAYYTARVREHGETARGVDWASEASQTLRFAKLLEVCRGETGFSLLDFGCGYGALLDVLRERGADVRYTGYDLSSEMVSRARERHRGFKDAVFTSESSPLARHDFVVASGVFNVKLGADETKWQEYVHETLDRLHALADRGFAFNLLSLYSDPAKRRPDLHYADPLALFDRCKRLYSPRVALLHDYPLWEFTLLVRSEAG